MWPSSADRKSPVCPAEFSPSTWTTEGQAKSKPALTPDSWKSPATTQHASHVFQASLALSMHPWVTMNFLSCL